MPALPFNLSRDSATIRLHLCGDVTADTASELHRQLVALSAEPGARAVEVDFSGAERLDTAGAVTLFLGCQRLETNGASCTLSNLSQQHQATLALARGKRKPALPEHRSSLLEQLGELALRARALYPFSEIVVDTGSSLLRSVVRLDRRRLTATAEQVVRLGVDSVPIVLLLNFLVGVILGFQGAFQLRKFGADVFMAELVSLGVVREFAPIITAIILAGRSGASIAAELGTMAVNEEVDALKAMGISPTQFLVLPRVAAITFAQPLLTVMSMVLGMAGGLAVTGAANLPTLVMLRRMLDSLTYADLALGLLKSVLFAWIIGWIGCYMGLSTRGGAHSVGRNTTAAVVSSIFFIVVTDSIVTTVWTLSYGGQ